METTFKQRTTQQVAGNIDAKAELLNHPLVEVEPEESAVVLIEKDKLSDLVMMTDRLSAMKPVASIRMDYKKFEKSGESCRGIFGGFIKVPNKEKVELDSILWIEQGGGRFYHSGVILVDECRKFKLRPGDAVEITYKGKKGKAMDFDIYIIK